MRCPKCGGLPVEAVDGLSAWDKCLNCGATMIVIVNISKHRGPWGEHEYELRINATVIATFRHKREEGLTVCLKKAAAAAERAKWEEAARANECNPGEGA